MSAVDVALKPKEFDLHLGPFEDSIAALAALVAQGLAVDAEVVGLPSGRWWITQCRQRSVKCGDCWTQTWSATGFCTKHLRSRGYDVPPSRAR